MRQMRGHNIPERFNLRVGDISVERGRDNGIRLFSWDAITDCNDTQCVADEICRYARIGKCTIQRNYLRAFQDIMFSK